MTRATEIRLIARCVLADDRDAFGQLVEEHTPRLKRFLMNLTGGDAYLTDDLAQDAFVKAYLNLRAFRGIASFGTWLTRIAYNEFYDYTRRQHELGEEAVTAAVEPRSTADADATAAAHDVQVALQALNPVERAVVTLFYIDDLPLKKVADITSLPVGTVKSHLHRAKIKMQNALTN